MIIGKLDTRITLQQATIGRDDYGAEGATYGNDKKIWAQIRNLRDVEKQVQQKQEDVHTLVFIVRYRKTIDTTHRIVHKGINYNIISIIDNGRKKRMELTATAKR